MTTYAEHVDNALDAMEVRTPGFDAFTAMDMANELICSRPMASTMLQMHRAAQTRGTTRWIVACRGYATSAEWYVLSGPGRAASNGAERLSMGHAAHVAADLRARAASDLASELRPSMLTHPAIQALLTGLSKQIENTVLNLVDSINVTLEMIEASTGLVADRRGVAT